MFSLLGKFPFSAQKSGSPGPGPGPGIVQWRFGVGASVPGSRPGLLRFEIKSVLRPVRARKVRGSVRCGWKRVHGFAWLSLAQPESVRQAAIFGVAQRGSGWLGQLEGKLGCQMKRWLVGI